MRLTIRAHFDGRVIIPDQPADLPVDAPLSVTVEAVVAPTSEPALPERQAAFVAFLKSAIENPVPSIPLDALRRENMYEDR